MKDYNISNDFDDFLIKSPAQLNREIADRVRARRRENKWSQEELSRRSNVSLGSLKRFESTGEISLTSLIKISIVLGCEDDFDQLFARKHYNSIEEIIREQS